MKKRSLILAVSSAVIISGIVYSVASAASSPVEEATNTLTKFLDAGKANNADEALQYFHDYRTNAISKTAFKESLSINPLLSYKILSVKKIDDTHAIAQVDETSKDTGENVIHYNVQKEGTDWKIVVTDQNANVIKFKQKDVSKTTSQ